MCNLYLVELVRPQPPDMSKNVFVGSSDHDVVKHGQEEVWSSLHEYTVFFGFRHSSIHKMTKYLTEKGKGIHI